jgi:signal transduction histidine kinase
MQAFKDKVVIVTGGASGIGLAIAKKVVENHNGIIMAEGKEHVGATIHIFLPE